MDSLDCKYYEPDLLDVKYDDRTNQNYDQNLETAAPSSAELDQELENLLLLMGESNTGIQDESTPVYDDFVDPTIEENEWLNADDLVDSKEFNYQVPNPCRGRFDYSVSHSNNYNYQANSTNNNHNTTTPYKTDRYNYKANSTSYNYSPSERNNYSYQVPSREFNYQSNRSNQFDYKPTTPKSFDRPSSSKNYSPIPHAQNNSGVSDHDQSILDVEVDQNTRVRLEVGVSATVRNGSARAAAYAKATIYRRG